MEAGTAGWNGVLDRLSDFPRTRMGLDPTPLEPLDRLTAATGGARLWAKRDDLNGVAFGGNKVRQLEYYFGQALAEGADTVLITGAVQSNYCRLAAAFAARLGMDCHIQQEERVAHETAAYRHSGNVLVERLLGATLHGYPAGEDEVGADANLEALADRLRASGRSPYVVHLAPGHPPLGALGYIHAAREVLEQAAAADLHFDTAVVPSGSGATHAGFLFGLRALGSNLPVIGVCVRRAADLQGRRIAERCEEIAAILGMANPVGDADIAVDDRFLGPGYGQLNRPTEQAILGAARTEAVILDPVYSGKAMAGALAIGRDLGKGSNVLFLHTGGSPAIFAYADLLGDVSASEPSDGT